MASSPHIALIPAAGMGHLVPFLRLAAMLGARGCTVTVITAHPTVSITESTHLSRFFTIHPHIRRLEFHLPPYQKSNFINEDPFFIQFENIANSIHLLQPLLSSSSPPLSALVADIPILSSVNRIASDLLVPVPVYVLVITSAQFFCLMVNIPRLFGHENDHVIEVPVLGRIPVSSIPPPMFNPNHFFSVGIVSNLPALKEAKGILINTFTGFESEAIQALNGMNELAPVLPVGPLEPYDIDEPTNLLPWLNSQAQESVLLVSFGSRTALSVDQIQELAAGLEKSGCTFLWVLKGNKVDKDDVKEVEELLTQGFLARTKEKGLVVKPRVNQDQILAHPCVGAFMTHCGWNSMMEAAMVGVPLLAWPQHGDQKVNAEVVERAGLGLWPRDWGWLGERLVGSDEIADKITEIMKMNTNMKLAKEKACQARKVDGSSELMLQGLIHSYKMEQA